MPALSSLPGTDQLDTNAKSDCFVFIAAGDNRPAKPSDTPTPTTGQIFTAAQRANPSLIACKDARPAFVFWTGDSIYGKAPNDESTVQSEYQAFLKVAAQSGVPVFNAPGNHEMDDKNDVPNAQMQAFYPKFMAEPYGAFNYGNSRFIALNTEEIAPQGTKKSARAKTDSGTTLDPGYVSQKQLGLLDADLKANQGKAHIFVFMHHPIKPYKADDGLDKKSAAALVAIFKKYKNVSYVIAGHEHMYFNPPPQSKHGWGKPPNRTDPSKNPPYYLVSGGAGAPLKGITKKHPPKGSYFHYLVFEVNGDKIKTVLVPLK
jgi:3',5'-cyclic AMP phosphodiesterase CpdA